MIRDHPAAPAAILLLLALVLFAHSSLGAASLKTVTLKVDGMTCPTCSYRVKKALLLPGLRKAEVSLEKGQAVVEYEEGRTTVEQMIAAVKEAGYSAKLITAGGQGR